MSLFRRTPAATPAPPAHAETIEGYRRHVAEEQAKAKAAEADLIARLSTRYYAAHAIVADRHASGNVGSSGHLIGVCSGLIEALAEVTGRDPISVGYRMEHGLSLVGDEVCVVDNNGTLPVILREGTDVREPVSERLDRLHREALKATGHPMYTVLYGPQSVGR